VMACCEANITRRERRRTLYDGSHRNILLKHVDDGYCCAWWELKTSMGGSIDHVVVKSTRACQTPEIQLVS
jgi:hypothetical protein